MNENDLIELIYSCGNDRKLLEDLILGLTTSGEREVLTRRIEIINKLLNGETQHNIALELGVGVSTVTRGAHELKNGRFKVLKEKKL